MKYFWGILTFLIVLSAACKKEKKGPDNPPPDNTPKISERMMNITANEWIIYKFVLGGTDFWLVPGVIDACNKDNTYRFYRDSVLTTYENTNICSGNTDSTRSNWEFVDNEKKVMATIFNITDTADILLLNTTNMNLSFDYGGQPGTVYFKKK